VNPYSYTSGEPRFNLHLKETTAKWWRYAVDFPTVYPTRFEEYSTVLGEYFQPRGVDNAPLAILLHGIGDYSLIPCKLLARTLVKRGIACFILRLVIHSSRMPEAVSKRMPNLTLEEWFENYQISVIDVRQVIDWAGGRAEIDGEQIAVIGISFGGFISAIAMGVDKRIRAGVFIVMGGNGEKITRKSRLGAIKKWYKHTEAEYHQIQNSYAQYLDEVAENGFENVKPVMESFLTDPMTFAYCLRQRPVLMINALWDEAIPREATLDFWEACGKPAIKWFPTTHGSIWLLYPVVSRKIAGFLSSAFDGRVDTLPLGRRR
jgi:dienelactone hydrolase|tara:strand:+ start:1535 stop:2491 length:957 start_codon:yes stop_codon:yes gene_type:complete